MTTHQIVLVTCSDDTNVTDSRRFIESIGEWDEVTTEELGILQQLRFKFRFEIIERNPYVEFPPKEQHLRTPKDYIEAFKKEEAERKIARKKQEKLTEAKKLEKKRRQLERLKQELGDK